MMVTQSHLHYLLKRMMTFLILIPLFGGGVRAQESDVAFRIERKVLRDSTLWFRIVREEGSSTGSEGVMRKGIGLFGESSYASVVIDGNARCIVMAVLTEAGEQRTLRVEEWRGSLSVARPELKLDGRAGPYDRYTLRIPVAGPATDDAMLLDSVILTIAHDRNSSETPSSNDPPLPLPSSASAQVSSPTPERIAIAGLRTSDGGVCRVTYQQLLDLGFRSDELAGITIRTAWEELYDIPASPVGSTDLSIIPIDYSSSADHLNDVIFFIPRLTRWYYRNGSVLPDHTISPYRTSIKTIIEPAPLLPPRLPRRDAPASAPAGPSKFVYGLAAHERDSVNIISLTADAGFMMAGTSFLGEMLGSGSTPIAESRTFHLALDHAARTGTVWIRILTGHPGNDKYPDLTCGRWFAVVEGDTVHRAPMTWRRSSGDPIAQHSAIFEIPAASINNDTLRITIGQEVYDQQPTFLDWIEVLYPQQPLLDGRPIDCWTGGVFGDSVLSIAGGDSLRPPLCLDITEQDHPAVVVPHRMAGAWVIRDTGLVSPHPRHYYIVDPADITECDSLTLEHFYDLRTGRAPTRLLVITTRELEDVVSARMRDRYRDNDTAVRIVTVDDIFLTYSAGNLEPSAVRRFVQEQASTSDDLHVLLVGDASVDYRDIGGHGGQGVITYQYDSPRGNVGATAASDDYFVCIDGSDDIPDLPIGRLPARTPEEADTMLSDANAYPHLQSGPWLARSIFAADDNSPDYSKIFSSAEASDHSVRDVLPPHIVPRKIFLPLYQGRMSEAKADLMWDWRHGARVIYWDGHGNTNVWAHEYLLDSREPLNLEQAFPPFIAALTCNFGFYDDPRFESGAERLLRSSHDRPAGVITSTRPLLVIDGQALQPLLVREMHASSSEEMTIGKALLRAKWSDPENDIHPGVVLFGDPTLPLRPPTSNIAITQVDNQPFPGEEIVVRNGAVILSGEIVGDSTIHRSGNVAITLYARGNDTTVNDFGKEITLRQQDEIIVSMNAALEEGRFTARVPLPPCAPDTTMRIGVHIVASGDRFVASTVRPFTVRRMEISDPVRDIVPPAATLRFEQVDDTTAMMVVTAHDTSGIMLPIAGGSLAPAFQYEGGEWRNVRRSEVSWSNGETRAVVMRVPLPKVASGYHHFRFRIADVACNVRLVDTLIPLGIDSEAGEVATRAFPNPAADEVRIRVAHSSLAGSNLRWRLMNVSGELAGEGGERACCGETEIRLDRDLLGGLPSGIYFVEIVIAPSSGIDPPAVANVPLILMR